jgi:hypothetical protein
MPRKTSRKPTGSRQGKRQAKRSTARSPRKTSGKAGGKRAAPGGSMPAPRLSREVVEELLVRSANAPEGDQLSDKALAEIALCASLDPAKILEAHRRLCAMAEETELGVLRVVEVWEP